VWIWGIGNGEMGTGKWRNGNGEMEKWRNGEMAKWRNGEMEKWRNGEMANGEMEKRGNGIKKHTSDIGIPIIIFLSLNILLQSMIIMFVFFVLILI
jgi:hypothetical protein